MGNLGAQIPIIGGLFDDTDQQVMDQLQKNQQIYGGLQPPSFGDYKPEDYQYLGGYNPTEAQATQVQDSPDLRNQQQSYLMKMAGLANTGLSDVDNLGFERARELGDQMSNSGTQAALQNAQARGVGGSGLEFAMREQASQDGATRAHDAALQQAAQSAQQRALYNQAYGGAIGNVRAQDQSLNQANANILNNFNQYNTGAKNQAAQYNYGQAQGISNANVQNQNQAQQYNNTLKQQGYEDQLQKANGLSGANTGAAQGYAAQNAANTDQRNKNTGLVFDALA